MTSRIFCDVCHYKIAISHFARHETTRKHKKNIEKAENNAGTVINPLLKKKQSDQTNDNDDDNPVIF
jgi:hypothetical protein